MKRAIICAFVDTQEHQVVVDWFSKWSARLGYCSPNEGCGCCVDIYKVEAPEEALVELPVKVISS
jgi:hypothetical protein